MIILLAILFLLNFAISVYFIAVFHERTVRFTRDINAIAQRLRILEDTAQAFQVAYDFRIKVVESRIFEDDNLETTVIFPKK